MATRKPSTPARPVAGTVTAMTTPHQAPTVGRIVHYSTRGSADGVYTSTCRAAVVTETNGNLGTSLAVLGPTGLFFDQMVKHDQSGKGGTWHWPTLDGECRPAAFGGQ